MIFYVIDVMPDKIFNLPLFLQVTILISPSKRAYSWYQHMRAHNDPIALNYTFYDILTAGAMSPKPLRDLRTRYVEQIDHKPYNALPGRFFGIYSCSSIF